MSQMRKSALSAGNLRIDVENSAVPSEVESLLEELLPHLSDAAHSSLQEDGAVPYSKLRRATLGNGIKAVRLPDGRHIARALDRRTGSIFWTIVRG